MKSIDNINTCTCGSNKSARVLQRANTVFNVFGIMFFVTFLGYVALHCL
jgi:Na+/phosphate symporter